VSPFASGGKTLRASKDADGGAEHPLSAFCAILCFVFEILKSVSPSPSRALTPIRDGRNRAIPPFASFRLIALRRVRGSRRTAFLIVPPRALFIGAATA